MNFNQSSYEVMENRYEVMIVIELSQPSSEPFDVMISLMNVTAEWYCLFVVLTKYVYLYCINNIYSRLGVRQSDHCYV